MASAETSVKYKLGKAYISMLTKKYYLDITVSDLVREAGVGRASFYRLFSSVDDVMDGISDVFYEKVTHEIMPLFFRDREQSLKNFLLKVYSKLKIDGDIGLPILPDNRNYVMSRLTKKFEKELTEIEISGTIKDKYILPVNVSITMTIAKHWMSMGFRESAEEVADLAYKLIKSNLDMQI
ncbi:MAG: TetR/AcrR family transcriptional regulator [Acutalibacteraceae bacterium]